ncbi:uncharacterized protein LOC125543953 [Triticum urartu]|uniref:uncharacterized protein LOC125543953 n=1 Tax=Triticum urartu TaxID=4572 RepID=UPI0020442F01|nr:uncharacterized protein LOC125543953 [Triticum urartu]
MAAAELSLADLQKLVQDTIQQSKAVLDAGAATSERVNELQDSLNKYASSSAKAFDALAQTTTASLGHTEATLGRVLIANNSLDAAMAEMKRALDGVVRRVDQLERVPATGPVQPPPSPPLQRSGPLHMEGQSSLPAPQATDLRGPRQNRPQPHGGELSQTRPAASEYFSDDQEDPDHSTDYGHRSHHNRYKPRVPSSMGWIPNGGNNSVKSTSGCTMCSRNYGSILQQCILQAMQLVGFRLTKPCTQSTVGQPCVLQCSPNSTEKIHQRY